MAKQLNSKWFDEDFYRGGEKGAKRDFESPFYGEFVGKVVRTYKGEHEGIKVLDVGAGMGYRTRIYLQNNMDVIGIDISEWARLNSVLPEDRHLCVDAREADKYFEEKSFDLVVIERVLGYLPKADALKAVQKLVSLSKKDVLFSIICSDHKDPVVAKKGKPGRINLTTKAFWLDIFEKCGLVINQEKTDIMLEGGWDCVWWCERKV